MPVVLSLSEMSSGNADKEIKHMLNRIRTQSLMASIGAICLYAIGSQYAMASPFYAGWQVVAPAGEGFSVEMPGFPRATTQTKDTAAGPTTIHWFRYDTSTEAYRVEYNEFMTAFNPKKVLEGARDGVEMVGKILYETDVTLNGHPGKMITGTSDGKTFLAAIYVVGPRLYQAIYVGSPAEALLHVGPFLKSFQLAR